MGNAMSKIKILITEDEVLTAECLRLDLDAMGYEVCTLAHSREEASKIAEMEQPDLALLDINLRGNIEGIDLANELRSQFNIKSILMSGYTKEDLSKKMARTETYTLLEKPVENHELRQAIESIVKEESD